MTGPSGLCEKEPAVLAAALRAETGAFAAKPGKDVLPEKRVLPATNPP